MNMYLSSDSISVFPLSKPRSISNSYPSRALTEDRIANIIRQLVDVEGFVISDSIGDSSVPFSFNLGGYFIELTKGVSSLINTDEASSSDAIWAVIQIENGEISGQDVSLQYQGVSFVFDEPEASSNTSVITRSLKILSKENGTWNIPAESQIKIKSRAVDFVGISLIDGKHS